MDLVVRHGRRVAIDGISLELGQGIVVLAGPNGSGKTTLLRLLATLRRPSHGQVSVAGLAPTSARSLREIRRRTGYLSQDPRQHGHLRVGEAVEYAAWLKGMPRQTRTTRVLEALDAVDLSRWKERRLGELSGGTRRRVHLAQALVHGPGVLLLDEPTTGVDAEHRVEFRALLRRVATGRLVILSTHLTEDIELLAERVIVLDHGRVAFDGTPEGLTDMGNKEGNKEANKEAEGDGPADRAASERLAQGSRPIERGLLAVVQRDLS